MGNDKSKKVRMRVVIFHDDADGRCAAALAGRDASGAEKVEYIPVEHGSSVPVLRTVGYDRTRDDLWLVDFSFGLDEMKELFLNAGGIGHFWWFDHHKTNLKDLEEISNYPGIRSSGFGACMLVWRFLQAGVRPPWAVEYISDHDAWKFNHGDESHWFHEAFLAEPDSRPQSVLWDMYFDTFVASEPELRNYLDKGEILRQAHMVRLSWMVQQLARPFVLVAHCGVSAKKYRGLRINCIGSGDVGELANRMGYDLAWCWVRREIDGQWVWKHSLYSRTMDVSDVCRELGGGGHEGAAGFEERSKVCRYTEMDEVHYRI